MQRIWFAHVLLELPPRPIRRRRLAHNVHVPEFLANRLTI